MAKRIEEDPNCAIADKAGAVEAGGGPPAKVAKLESSSSFAEEPAAPAPEDLIHELWFPLMREWQWQAADGRMMVSIKFVVSCGMSPGNTEGIDIHAVGQTCSITADWPKEFYEMTRVRKYYNAEELKDPDTVRMLNAEEDNIRYVVKQAGITPRAVVDVPLPFPVIETNNPVMKIVTIKKTNTRMVTIRLASTVFPTFAKKSVKKDEQFED